MAAEEGSRCSNLEVKASAIKCAEVGVTDRTAGCCRNVDTFSFHTTFLYSTFHLFTRVPWRCGRGDTYRKYKHTININTWTNM